MITDYQLPVISIGYFVTQSFKSLIYPLILLGKMVGVIGIEPNARMKNSL